MKTLNLPNTFIEPSVYIGRFVAMLEFGEDQAQVALDATRIAARFKEDWIHEGRRTSGICGAAIYLAAQMNNYRRSIQEIVQVVKIADTTIIKRLEEFSATTSANLTVGDFRTTGKPTVEADPPSFTKARMKELEEVEGPGAGSVRKRRRKRSRSEMEDDESVVAPSERESAAPSPPPDQEGDIAQPSTRTEGVEILEGILPPTSSTQVPSTSPSHSQDAPNGHGTSVEELQVDPAQVEEVQEILDSAAGQSALAMVQTTTVARRAEGAAQTATVEDDLNDLDEEELNGYICGEEEAYIKERVWTELNLDYLRKLAAKRIQDQTGEDIRAKKVSVLRVRCICQLTLMTNSIAETKSEEKGAFHARKDGI
jgi:transcription factor IIIB subunit 2